MLPEDPKKGIICQHVGYIPLSKKPPLFISITCTLCYLRFFNCASHIKDVENVPLQCWRMEKHLLRMVLVITRAKKCFPSPSKERLFSKGVYCNSTSEAKSVCTDRGPFKGTSSVTFVQEANNNRFIMCLLHTGHFTNITSFEPHRKLIAWVLLYQFYRSRKLIL